MPLEEIVMALNTRADIFPFKTSVLTTYLLRFLTKYLIIVVSMFLE